MSEDRARYSAEGPAQELPPGTLLKYTNQDYQHPTPEDVRTLKAISGMTGRELCELAGIDDSRSFRRWTAKPGAGQKAKISYSVWRLLLIELKLVSPKAKGCALPKDQDKAAS